KKNIDPGFLLNVLRSMGKLDLVADTSGIPPLADLEHDNLHMSWSGTLETTSPQSEIESIFAPVAGDCEFTLSDLTPGAAAAPAGAPAAAAPAPPRAPRPDPGPRHAGPGGSHGAARSNRSSPTGAGCARQRGARRGRQAGRLLGHHPGRVGKDRPGGQH